MNHFISQIFRIPRFSQISFLRKNFFVLDLKNIRQRYLDDTMYLVHREANGEDRRSDELLTEAGIEVHHPLTHYYGKNLDTFIP